MNIDEVSYILFEVEWKSCIIVTNSIDASNVDIINKEEISIRHGMLYVEREDSKTFVSMDSIIGFKLFDYDKGEYLDALFRPVARVERDLDDYFNLG